MLVGWDVCQGIDVGLGWVGRRCVVGLIVGGLRGADAEMLAESEVGWFLTVGG